MAFFTKIIDWFKRKVRWQRKQKEWAERFDQEPAKPKNPLPLDPGRDPWMT